MRLSVAKVVILVATLPLAGCGPSISDEELGRVVHELPEIPAGYEPYRLPSLIAPESAGEAEEPESG